MKIEKIKEIKLCMDTIELLADYCGDLNNADSNARAVNKMQRMKEEILAHLTTHLQ